MLLSAFLSIKKKTSLIYLATLKADSWTSVGNLKMSSSVSISSPGFGNYAALFVSPPPFYAFSTARDSPKRTNNTIYFILNLKLLF